MKDSRILTGNWFLKRRNFFGFDIMVEVMKTSICISDFSESPQYTIWEKAQDSDIIELGIKCC
jgi:hypothetical protein